jgi:hypothetical protein
MVEEKQTQGFALVELPEVLLDLATPVGQGKKFVRSAQIKRLVKSQIFQVIAHHGGRILGLGQAQD